MQTDDFEWDNNKAQENSAKHLVTFEDMTWAFDDPNAVEYPDETEDYGEERWIIIGFGERELLQGVYTMRGHRIRIISARRPDDYERDRYNRARE